MKLLSPTLLAVSALAAVVSASSPRYMKNFVSGKKPVALKAPVVHSTSHQAEDGPCSPGNLTTTKSPLPNIFAALTADEAASVTKFLHMQDELNLTANANATRCVPSLRHRINVTDLAGFSWDNVIVIAELLEPNKTDALPFLNGKGARPARYAKATIQFQATLEPYLKEYMIGPLPVSNQTTLQPLNYPYNKGVGYQRIYNADPDLYNEFLVNISASVEDILMTMMNGVSLTSSSAKQASPKFLTFHLDFYQFTNRFCVSGPERSSLD